MSNELSHHGVIGQKWGIRRYQNSDGSLTPQGRLRYHYSTGAKLTKNERKQQKNMKLRRAQLHIRKDKTFVPINHFKKLIELI